MFHLHTERDDDLGSNAYYYCVDGKTLQKTI